MSEIFREVDEEVRHEQMIKLWRAYGKYAIALAAAVIFGVVGSVGWKEYSLKQRLVDGTQFAQALELLNDDQPALAAERFARLADSAGAGYAALAQLRHAEAQAASGDTAGAIITLDALAEDGSVDEDLRDLASLLAVLHLLDKGPTDGLDQRIEPLLAADSPWRASAREISGLIAFRRGDTERAREIFTELVGSAETPNGIRSRAAELVAILGGDGT